MLVALPISRINTSAKKSLRLLRAVVLRQGLRVHLVTRNVIRICFQEGFEMRLRSRDVALAQTLKGDAVT